MKALVYSKGKTPCKFSFTDTAKPQLKEDQVLIKIAYTSVNAADYRSINMGMVPKHKIFGASVTGIVDSIGKNITKFKPGDEVLGDLSDSGFGCLAEFVAAKEQLLIHKPDQIPFDIAAALPLAATTALAAFRKKEVITPGQKVLILGSSGGVGTFATQLAKYYGMHVTGVCSSRNIKQTLQIGADKAIDYTKVDIKSINEQYDLILAINGNYSLLNCKRLLKTNGVYVVVGGSISQLFKTMIFGRFLSLGSKKMCFLAAKANTNDLQKVTDLAVNGKIKAIIEKTYSLEDAGNAMEYVSNGHASAKIVIKIQD